MTRVSASRSVNIPIRRSPSTTMIAPTFFFVISFAACAMVVCGAAVSSFFRSITLRMR